MLRPPPPKTKKEKKRDIHRDRKGQARICWYYFKHVASTGDLRHAVVNNGDYNISGMLNLTWLRQS